jgi:hypothetical protein
MGKHEDPIRFKHSMVIDIYDLEHSKYLYSLSIPNPGEKAVNQMRIVNDHLFVLSEQFIYRFKISLPGLAKTGRLLEKIKI